MKRRHLILLFGGASSGALSVGTGAFSSAEAKRGVSVGVADDDSAFVGYVASDRTVPEDENDDGTLDLVTVTNRFRNEITVTEVELGDGDDVLADVYFPEEAFETGGKRTITATVDGIDPGDTVDVEVTVTVEGVDAGVAARLFGDAETRRFTITREAASVEDPAVEFFGAGNAEVLGEDRTETIDVYYTSPGQSGDGGVTVDEGVEIETEDKLRGQLSGVSGNGNGNGSNGDTIVAVGLDGTIYVHPQWSDDECGLVQSNEGGFGIPSDDPPTCEAD
ncbi:hypothetical protein GRS48_13005 [Halorubrum sp. JWXQ-INN 858]|uniref:hypothetical protein n=1 Tax=Halorubrum sp. JWXQ-INN 858 TaxID=2690782 RepID=UPI001356F70D|nr:hypothetical protein [Halorubrum sp. JWXQ-INN 858]MWV65732.1 hypothetical protein [Halorubrum sp. JWXQ-INN 858]